MLHNLQSISIKSEFLRNSKNSSSLGCFLEHFFESFFKKYLFSNNENSTQYKSREPLPQIDVAETDSAYYFQIELPEVYKQNAEKDLDKNENSLIDNKKQGVTDLKRRIIKGQFSAP